MSLTPCFPVTHVVHVSGLLIFVPLGGGKGSGKEKALLLPGPGGPAGRGGEGPTATDGRRRG